MKVHFCTSAQTTCCVRLGKIQGETEEDASRRLEQGKQLAASLKGTLSKEEFYNELVQRGIKTAGGYGTRDGPGAEKMKSLMTEAKAYGHSVGRMKVRQSSHVASLIFLPFAAIYQYVLEVIMPIADQQVYLHIGGHAGVAARLRANDTEYSTTFGGIGRISIKDEYGIDFDDKKDVYIGGTQKDRSLVGVNWKSAAVDKLLDLVIANDASWNVGLVKEFVRELKGEDGRIWKIDYVAKQGTVNDGKGIRAKTLSVSKAADLLHERFRSRKANEK